MKLPAASTKASRTASEAFWSVVHPNVLPPRQRADTRSPVRPSLRISIMVSFRARTAPASRRSALAREGVELAAAHAGNIRRGGDGAGEVGVPELAVVVHPGDLEAAGFEQAPHFLRIQQPVLRVVLDLGTPRDMPEPPPREH